MVHGACAPQVHSEFLEAQKVQPKGKTVLAEMALAMINKLYGFERKLKNVSDEQCLIGRQEKSLPLLGHLKGWWTSRTPM